MIVFEGLFLLTMLLSHITQVKEMIEMHEGALPTQGSNSCLVF